MQRNPKRMTKAGTYESAKGAFKRRGNAKTKTLRAHRAGRPVRW